ncbi:hypothetical protein QBC32DRAFT_67265 [Pseudoneurospora amorphoporcata]|uniref:Uncharacterized protein n=1 Tax=Pseudoneurospora amorphoporcata TaxID=241081 RepID=A0AAN6SC01_9PEZI|nr:hypothetical protein QBC32DRAFT_67265 [Pseudoneurospora amorphoporcata]
MVITQFRTTDTFSLFLILWGELMVSKWEVVVFLSIVICDGLCAAHPNDYQLPLQIISNIVRWGYILEATFCDFV